MEFPFFGNYWNYPRHHWAEEETPVMNPRHWAGGVESPAMNRQTRSPFVREPRRRMEVETPVVNRQSRSSFPESRQTGMEKPKAASKVVDIPVRFVGSVRSETMKATAAVKIQKVFRGLLVRKSVKKIVGIRKEVDEIEKRVSEKETILLLRRDAKERLKINEMLMALLLRLDSIRGVDAGVRDFRKSVIKKAIMLQERVDEIVSGDVDMVDTGETVQMQVQEEEECCADTLEPVAEVVGLEASGNLVDEDLKLAADSLEPVAEVVGLEASGNLVDEDLKLAADSLEPVAEVVDQNLEIKVSENVVNEDREADNHVHDSENDNAGHYEAMVEAPADCTSELQQVSVEYETAVQSQDNFHTVSDIEDENLNEEEEDLMDIQGEKTQNEDSSLGVVEGGEEKKLEEKNDSNNRDLIERMIEGNERLTGLVSQLCERQESQSRLLSSLSQRVENLEKAFRCERSKRKKKRNANNNKL